VGVPGARGRLVCEEEREGVAVSLRCWVWGGGWRGELREGDSAGEPGLWIRGRRYGRRGGCLLGG